MREDFLMIWCCSIVFDSVDLLCLKSMGERADRQNYEMYRAAYVRSGLNNGMDGIIWDERLKDYAFQRFQPCSLSLATISLPRLLEMGMLSGKRSDFK